MTEIPVRIDPIAHQLLELPDIGEAPIPLALPDQFAIETDLENAGRAGPHATASISRLKVESTSCAIQAERRSQLHCVQ